MSVALWLLGAGVGVFAIVMMLSLCIVAAKETPTPPRDRVLTMHLGSRTVRERAAVVRMDFRHPVAELHASDGIG
jgi:hypothetical protein